MDMSTFKALSTMLRICRLTLRGPVSSPSTRERSSSRFRLLHAAELLSMHRATLVGWLDRATGGEGEWVPERRLGNVTINVNVGL